MRRAVGSVIGSVALIFAGLAGCVIDHTHVDPPPTAARFPAIAIDPAANPGATELVAAVRSVIASPRFRDVLANTEDLHINGNGHAIAGSDVLVALLVDTEPAHLGVARSDVSYELAETHVTAADATILLAPSVLAMWKRPVVEDRGCAVDALAHAFAHTVRDADGKPRFGDNVSTFVRTPGRRVATYAVGAIAACVYLEATDKAFAGFDACLDRFVARESTCLRPPPG